jgi:hypothetical protein
MLKLVMILLIIALLMNAARQTAQDPPDSARIGMMPEKWGPMVWVSLHLMALNTAREFGSSSRNFDRYLYSLQTVLPCRECRDEMKLIMDTVPPREFIKYGRIGCVAYIYVIHCTVSDRTKGVQCTVKFLDEEQKYLTDYVKPGGVNVGQTMQDLRDDAETHNIARLIEDAQTALRRMLSDRTARGRPANRF